MRPFLACTHCHSAPDRSCARSATRRRGVCRQPLLFCAQRHHDSRGTHSNRTTLPNRFRREAKRFQRRGKRYRCPADRRATAKRRSRRLVKRRTQALRRLYAAGRVCGPRPFRTVHSIRTCGWRRLYDADQGQYECHAMTDCYRRWPRPARRACRWCVIPVGARWGQDLPARLVSLRMSWKTSRDCLSFMSFDDVGLSRARSASIAHSGSVINLMRHFCPRPVGAGFSV